jgi:hypothetical protein
LKSLISVNLYNNRIPDIDIRNLYVIYTP